MLALFIWKQVDQFLEGTVLLLVHLHKTTIYQKKFTTS